MDNKCQVNTCDITNALKEIKPRYNAVIIYSLKNGIKSFSKIKEEFSYMSNEQINRALKNLIKNNIIEKDKEYKLTEKGQEVHTILKLLEKNYIKYEAKK